MSSSPYGAGSGRGAIGALTSACADVQANKEANKNTFEKRMPIGRARRGDDLEARTYMRAIGCKSS